MKVHVVLIDISGIYICSCTCLDTLYRVRHVIGLELRANNWLRVINCEAIVALAPINRFRFAHINIDVQIFFRHGAFHFCGRK